MEPTWGPPGSCRPQVGPMLAPKKPCYQGCVTFRSDRAQAATAPVAIEVMAFIDNDVMNAGPTTVDTPDYYPSTGPEMEDTAALLGETLRPSRDDDNGCINRALHREKGVVTEQWALDIMVTSWPRNALILTGPSWRESNCHRLIPSQWTNNALMFLCS